ncbi:MAG: PP2C family protein-serine/threonine phosphatase [Candidatus Krumholzibacteriota bacterium]|nr:PP2C family protein-serine/threonine phosphatase [Candidatus Krumholzibacteriota bacterium]
MNTGDFHPKVFYRKLDSLLVRIGNSANTKDVLSLVLEELVKFFGVELGIKSGSIYKLRFGSFHLVEGPVGDPEGLWPVSIFKNDPVFGLLFEHKSYIFADSASSPWGINCVAVMVGENDQFMLVLMLDEGWQRESLQFTLNTIRSTVNYSRSTSRFNADIQEAYEIQKSLLPRNDPHFKGYDISGRFVPAERVGGDLYDFNILEEGVLSFAIGDASGHGLPAALLARDVVTGLRMGIENDMKISSVIRKLNAVIHKSQLSTRFVSLVYGELERNGTLVYINAGHPPPLHFRDGSVTQLDVGGTILGPLEETIFNRGFAFMDPGDLLVMFSDGIFEITNSDNDMYGTERLTDVVGQNKGESSAVIIDRVFKSITAFRGSSIFSDDATLLVIKRVE